MVVLNWNIRNANILPHFFSFLKIWGYCLIQSKLHNWLFFSISINQNIECLRESYAMQEQKLNCSWLKNKSQNPIKKLKWLMLQLLTVGGLCVKPILHFSNKFFILLFIPAFSLLNFMRNTVNLGSLVPEDMLIPSEVSWWRVDLIKMQFVYEKTANIFSDSWIQEYSFEYWYPVEVSVRNWIQLQLDR